MKNIGLQFFITYLALLLSGLGIGIISAVLGSVDYFAPSIGLLIVAQVFLVRALMWFITED